MQILVVDCFGVGEDSRDKFSVFLNGIKKAFEDLWPFERNYTVSAPSFLPQPPPCYIKLHQSSSVMNSPLLETFDDSGK